MHELKHSGLDLLYLHNYYLISFQMQQPDLQLNIWLSANILNLFDSRMVPVHEMFRGGY